MADEYRGLYVRFGGDTTKLQSALKAAESAAAKTQRQLTQVNKAMRFDSGNVGNAETKLKMLSNRAESLGSQLKITQTAYRQLASTEINGKKVAELAQETNNASLAAANANQRYNAVNKELEKMYRLINEAGKESFGGAFDIRESEDIAQPGNHHRRGRRPRPPVARLVGRRLRRAEVHAGRPAAGADWQQVPGTGERD